MAETLTAQAIQTGKGKGRDPWMIRRFLANLNPPLSPAAIARELGVTRSAVAQVINGTGSSARIVQALEAKGCPAEYLYGRQKGGKAA